MCVSAQGEIEMATIADGFGLDMVQKSEVRKVSPEGYMLAHMMGVIARSDRRKMYEEMLAHGILYGNDNLAIKGLEGVIFHMFMKTEISTEQGVEFLEEPFDENKENQFFEQAEKVLCLLGEIVNNYYFYARGPTNYVGITPHLSSKYVIALPKTWDFLIGQVSSLFTLRKVFGDDKGQVQSVNKKAFTLYFRLGTNDIFRDSAKKVGNDAGYGWQDHYLIGEAREDILKRLKSDVNAMDLSRVIFWLKYDEGKMPNDFLKIFRIEYARKGGKLDL